MLAFGGVGMTPNPKIGSLFSGSGMLDEGVRAVLGGSVAWHAEIDPAASKLLAHRYPGVPNLGDLSAVKWTPDCPTCGMPMTVGDYRDGWWCYPCDRAVSVDYAAAAWPHVPRPVDVLTGGFPCQDVSPAGKRAGMRAGTRSGLWAAMCDAVEALRPSLVVAENVRGLLSAEADSALEPCAGCVGDGDDGAVLRALGRVLGDLADLGYDASWYGLPAADVGAPHGRFRVFIVAADAERVRRYGRPSDAWRGEVERTAATGPGAASRSGGERRGRSGNLAGATTANADHEGSQGREPAAGRDVSARGADAVAPDAGRRELQRRRGSGAVGGAAAAGRIDGAERKRLRDAAVDRRAAATDADGDGLARIRGELAERRDPDRRSGSDIAWGQYEPAIRRWEAVTGQPAPAPTEPGPRGGQRLSPRLTEWMMGWPDGWVTDVPGISRNDALKICGNGVVPQHAAEALRRILAARAAA